MDVQKAKISAVLGASGVVLGAFGAHALRELLEAQQLDSWKTGVLYLFVHTGIMLLLSLASLNKPQRRVATTSWWLFFVGIVLFSGSIFFLSLKDQLPFSVSWLGPVTPIGGVCFIAGWLLLLRLPSSDSR